MKCSINSDEISTQRTLAEWFKKSKINEETNNEKNGNSTSKELTIDKKKSEASIRTVSTNRQVVDKENVSDDDFIGSSQDVTESTLRKMMNKSRNKIFEIPKSTVKKSECIPTSDLKLSFSDVESSIIKEELDNMYNDIYADEMTHDLSEIVANVDFRADILKHSPPIGDFLSVQLKEEVDDTQSHHSQDSLCAIKKDVVAYKSSSRKRRKSSLSEVKAKKQKISTPLGKHLENNQDEEFLAPEIDSPENKNKTVKNNQLKIKTEDMLSSKEIKKLSLLRVKLQHEVPPQHNIENTAGSHSLNMDQIEKFQTFGPLKKGSYSPHEDKLIEENWILFCEIHGWDKNKFGPFLSMRHGVDYYIPSLNERKNFVKFLAKGLPWRTLHSVYCRFRNIYGPSENNGKFTSKEDGIILQYMKNKSKIKVSNGCAELADKLKRTRLSVWQRIQKLKKIHDLNENPYNENHLDKDTKNMKSLVNRKQMSKVACEKVYTNVKWTPPLVRKFINTLTEIFSCSKLDDLKCEIIDQWMWNEMEEKTNIDRLVLQKFWYFQLHMQLFCPRPIYLSDCKIKLIKHLYENKIVAKKMIIWENICMHFDGVTPFFLSKLLEDLIQYARTKIESSQFKDLVDYLYSIHITELKENPIDAILPKLYYKNGRIISIDKGPPDELLNISNDPHSNN